MNGTKKLKVTQPVLIQSLNGEFKLPGRTPVTPAVEGSVLTKGEPSLVLNPEMQTKYRDGVGKLMYLMRYSRPDIYNVVRNLARHMVAPNQGHYDAMIRTMACVVGTP